MIEVSKIENHGGCATPKAAVEEITERVQASRRRLFLLGLALLPGAHSLSALVEKRSLEALSETAASEKSLERLLRVCFPTAGARSTAARVGSRCARSLPATEMHIPLSFRAAQLMGASPSALRAFVSRRLHEDLRAGRVANVDGWILAETEVRLYGTAHRVFAQQSRG
jgi:hypothetical protein